MRRVVSVILDGLRRDFVTEAHMSRLASFSRGAETIDGYKSIAPSVTRVCSSTFTTGCFPAKHGVEGNSYALMEDGRYQIYDTGRPDFLSEKKRITGTRLNRRGIAELVEGKGGSIVYSNVSPGAAYAHDPQGFGIVHHRAGSFKKGVAMPNEEQLKIDASLDGDRAMTELFIADALRDQRPAFALLWLGHPDSTQHEVPLGSPEHLAALRACDALAGKVIDRVEELRRQGDEILLLIGSDHGHQTVREVVDAQEEICKLGFSSAVDSGDIVIVPNATAVLVYATTVGQRLIAELTEKLQGEPWIGKIIGADELETIGQTSSRGLALFITMAADESHNEFGIPGQSYAAKPLFDKPDRLGCGQHGGLGRFEQSPVLMLDGEGFSAGEVNPKAASLADIAPTVLRHLGVTFDGMDGAPLQSS